MKTSILRKVYATLFGLAISMTARAQSLDEAIHYTLRTNPDLLIQEAHKRVSDQELRSAVAGYLPKVDIAAGLGLERSDNTTTQSATGGARTLTRRESSISLSQTVFDGYFTKSNVEASMANVKSRAKNVISTMEAVTLRTIESYLEVLRLIDVVQYAKENLAHHQEIYQQLQLRTESGINKKADIDQAIGRLALARTNLMTEQANLRDAEATYIRTVGVAPIELIRPDAPEDQVLPSGEEASVSMALMYHPELQEANANMQAALAAKRKAKASYYPTVNFEMQGADDNNLSGSKSNTRTFNMMLRMNYNLYRGGADLAEEKKTAWEYERAKEEYNLVKRQVEQSMRIAWNAFSSARAKLAYHKKHVEATGRTRDAYEQQFSVGQRTLLDLLDSENELFESKTAYISAQYSEMLGKFRVLQSMGRIAKYFNLPMPETTTYQTKLTWFDGF